ncbi:MAG: hypothetical protein HY200_03395 [Nitrospirae bacterium]|nr:hypothetical protein [Nitrospirota bacterium]MBI3593976.1 hypothetical protein [Nitrospirota bacterium]
MSNPDFSTTAASEGTVPVFKATPSEKGTTVPPFSSSSTFSATALGYGTTSTTQPTLPPLEDFPLKPLEWGKWSVGLLIGVYHPSLDLLNHILSDPNLGIVQDPNFLLPGNPDFPTTKRNIVTPHIFGLAEYGIEGQLEINPKYSFTFAFASWQGESRAEDSVTIFTRSNQPPSVVPRDARYHVTINQFWWGLRYHFMNEPGKKKFYLNIGLLGVSGAYLTMDSLERVITNNNLSFDSVSVTEASGYGFSTRFGAGGEYHFQKWLSIGTNINYVMGKISTLKVSRYFSSGFGEPLPAPPDSLPPDPTIPIPQPATLPVPGDTITYAPMTTIGAADFMGKPQNLSLDLDGFDVTFYIQFHF